MSRPLSTEAVVAAALGVAAWAVMWRAARRERLRTSWVAGKDWERKRAQFGQLLADNLLVITDFDATLTSGDSDQCHDLMGTSPLLSKAFRREFAPLLDW